MSTLEQNQQLISLVTDYRHMVDAMTKKLEYADRVMVAWAEQDEQAYRFAVEQAGKEASVLDI